MLAINCTKLEHEEASSKRGNVTILGLLVQITVAEFLHVALKSIEKHSPGVFFLTSFHSIYKKKKQAKKHCQRPLFCFT